MGATLSDRDPTPHTRLSCSRNAVEYDCVLHEWRMENVGAEPAAAVTAPGMANSGLRFSESSFSMNDLRW